MASVYLLISAVLLTVPPGAKACPPCEAGFIQSACRCVKCPVGTFWSRMNGKAKCNSCTTACTVKKNLIEVAPCTKTTDRRCQCKAGFYCPSPVGLTCRRDCQPCTGGYTSAENLNRTCSSFTDCASVGMLVIKEGSSTTDRVCGHQKPRSLYAANTLHTPDAPNTPEAPHTPSTPYTPEALNTPYTPYTPKALYTSDTPDTTTRSLVSSTLKPSDFTSTASDTTAQSSLPQPNIAQTEREGPVSPSEPLSKTTWIFLLLLLLAVCMVSYLFLRYRRRAIKKNLMWAGRAFGRHQPVSPTSDPNTEETLLPVSAVRQARGQGSNQQVTMEHNGKADGINNTVGSIFIYSPGMVILGSNSNEKKEEPETSGEDGGGDDEEDGPLVSVPQQESSSERDVRMATQEELGKELSVPVPATSK